jgi:hypothetical protein
LLLLVLSATVTITTITASPEQQRVYVDPENNQFSTTTTSIGDEFNITIVAADWPDPGVYSFELKLYYNATMLEPVAEGTGIDPSFWITTFIAAYGMDLSVDPPQPYEDGEGNPFLWFSATLLGAGGKLGGGILAKASFEIIAEPLEGETLSSDLELTDVIIVDPSTTPPSAYPEDYYELIGGTYQYSSVVAPNTPPEASNLVITPSHPQATADLVGSYDYNDADGDSESGSEIRWYKDGLLQAAYNDTLNVPSSATSLDEEWYFTVKPSDGKDFGTLETSPTVTIVTMPERREDLNGDGSVNIEDLAIWGAAFGSNTEHPRWNAMADLNEDGKVNMIDGVLIAKEFDI